MFSDNPFVVAPNWLMSGSHPAAPSGRQVKPPVRHRALLPEQCLGHFPASQVEMHVPAFPARVAGSPSVFRVPRAAVPEVENEHSIGAASLNLSGVFLRSLPGTAH